MTVLNIPRPDDFSSFRLVFQRLFDRASELVSQADNANERANAVIKSLEILRLERLVYTSSSGENFLADWRSRVATSLETVRETIATVESRTERAYLRRLALDAALALNACDEIFFVEPTADALLAEIDNAEERQNALVAYSRRLADRIARFRLSDAPERAKALAQLEEIEDLRIFEEAAATVVAAVLFDATRRDDAPLVAVSNRDDATLDLTPFGNDVADVWEQFESPGGFLELCERAARDVFAFYSAAGSAAPLPQEIALRQAFNAETRRRLTQIATALDADVDLDGAPLDDDALDELQSVVDEAVVSSPFALENGEFFRAFLERSGNLAAYFPIFERLVEAEKTVSATRNVSPDSALPSNATDYRRSFYRNDADFFAAEKTRWLESARNVATSLSADADDLYDELDNLTTSAEIEFRFGDKTVAKNVVRKLLGRLPRLDTAFERAQFYERLVDAHIEASYPKAAQKLASLWKAEMDAIEPEDFRDAALGDGFDLYAQVVKLDATLISDFLAPLADPLIRLECETRFQLARLFAQADSPAKADVAQVATIVDAAVKPSKAFTDAAPDEAVFALVKIAFALAERLDVVSPDAFAHP